MKQVKLADFALFVIRLCLGAVMVYYGSMKLFGAFGGPGFQATLASMEADKQIPQAVGMLVIAGEFAGGLGLIFGVLTRVAAFGVMCVMFGAVYFNLQKEGA